MKVFLALAVFLALGMTVALGTALVPMAPGNGPAIFEQDCWGTDFSTAKNRKASPEEEFSFAK